jgi:hypothetical protein
LGGSFGEENVNKIVADSPPFPSYDAFTLMSALYPSALYPGKGPQCPLDRRLCGPQSRSGHRDNNYMYFYQILERNTLQTITIIHSDINVTALLLGNGDESERRVVYIFLSK